MSLHALTRTVCFRAMTDRDPRFEGRFVAAVRTTGIYCRPTCPAPLPKQRNVVFFDNHASAEAAGFRPCRRCRPDLAAALPAWPDTSRSISRAVRLIAAGALDGEGRLADLASRLGMSERHLRRLFARHLGTSPVSVAKSQRLRHARRLLDETALPITEIALLAGFSSIRRFNDVFRRAFAMSPSEVRSTRVRPPKAESA